MEREDIRHEHWHVCIEDSIPKCLTIALGAYECSSHKVVLVQAAKPNSFPKDLASTT